MKKFMRSIAIIMIIAISITSTGVLSGNCKQVVLAKTTAKKKIKLNKKKATMRVGKTLKLKLKNAKAKKVKWKSSNKKVATVSKKGVVKALKKGKVTITAKYKGKKYKCKIKINKTVKRSAKTINGYSINQAEYLIDNLYDGKNIIVSPASLNMVLGMAANGATGTAKKDLETYLGKNISEYNKYATKIMQRSKTDKMLTMANGVWYKQGMTINPTFNNAVVKNYNAVVKQTPMDQTTVDEVNQWASDNTDEMIKKVIEQIPDYTVSLLANALLFKGEWTRPFEAEDTYNDKFTKLNGKKVSVKMMHNTEGIYYENDYATGFEKTYGDNKEYSFIAILPKVKGEFNLSNLNIESFLKSKTDKYDVKISMPKFTYSWNSASNKVTLNDVLQKTGIKSIYDYRINPLGNILQTSASVYASDITQSCKIIVDEEGTKAAAVTIVVIKVTSALVKPTPVKKVDLNRPFGYIIMDNTTNEVLFMGKVIDPTQE